MHADDFGKLNTAPEPAWYRQFWPWFIILFPLGAVIGGMATLYLAIESDDGLVVDNYYKRGLAINADLSKDHRATELGLDAVIDFDPQGKLRLQLHSSKVASLPLLAMRLRLVHPTRAHQDQLIELDGSSGTYLGDYDPLAKGYWHLQLETLGGDWRLTGRAHLPGQHRVQLKARQLAWYQP